MIVWFSRNDDQASMPIGGCFDYYYHYALPIDAMEALDSAARRTKRNCRDNAKTNAYKSGIEIWDLPFQAFIMS